MAEAFTDMVRVLDRHKQVDIQTSSQKHFEVWATFVGRNMSCFTSWAYNIVELLHLHQFCEDVVLSGCSVHLGTTAIDISPPSWG